jgi:hypothetical protein
MANQIANRVHAQAVIQILSSTDHRFVENAGFKNLVRLSTGEYVANLEEPLDYKIDADTTHVDRYRTVPTVQNLAGNSAQVVVGGIPINATGLSAGVDPGSIAIGTYAVDPETGPALADDGLFLLTVWQFPTTD